MTAASRGRCLCGAITFELAGEPASLALCHCRSCRLAAGATPVAWATWPRAALRPLTGRPQWFASSPGVRRGFCRACGSSLLYESDRAPGELDVAIAALDDADAHAPDRHIWVPDKLAWIRVDDGRPCHVADSGSPTLP